MKVHQIIIPKAEKTNAENHFNRANNLFNIGHYKDAILIYDEAIRLRNDYPHAFLGRAMAKRYQNNIRGALSDFALALKLKKDFPEAFVGRASLYIEINDHFRAQKDLTCALQIYKTWHNRSAMTAVKMMIDQLTPITPPNLKPSPWVLLWKKLKPRKWVASEWKLSFWKSLRWKSLKWE